MTIVGLESIKEDEKSCHGHQTVIAELEAMRVRIAIEGFSRNDAEVLKQYCPDAFEGVNMNMFTQNPSATKADFALEAIDWRKATAAFAIGASLIALIGKLLSWFNDSLAPSSAGSISDVSNLNQTLETRFKDAKPVKELKKEYTQTATKKVVSKVKTLADCDVKYFNILLKKLDEGTLVNQEGKEVPVNDVLAACNNHQDLYRALRLSDKDAQGNALLGHMLLTRRTTLSVVLDRINWNNAKSKELLNDTHVTGARYLMEMAGVLLTAANELCTKLMDIDHRKLSVVNPQNSGKIDGIDGKTGDGVIAYTVCLNAHKELAAARDRFDRDYVMRQLFSPVVASHLTSNDLDTALQGRFKPDFKSNVSELLTGIREDHRTIISLWDNDKYQTGDRRVRAIEYKHIVAGLIDPKARTSLAKFYEAFYVERKGEVKSVLNEELDVVNRMYKTVSGNAVLINKEARKPERAWMATKILSARDAGFDNGDDVSYDVVVPLTALNELTQTASVLITRSSEIVSATKAACSVAKLAIEEVSKIK